MEWLFWGSVSVIVYTYVGYPIQLWLTARFFPKPVQKTTQTPEVIMIVVGHNEAHRIEAKIQTCLAQHYPADRLRVLVVSDGSTDATEDVVKRYPDPRVSLLACPVRRGKAACLNDGVAHTQAPIIVFTDARQRLHPEAVARLVANFAEPEIGVVSGELVFEQEDGSPFADGIGAYWLYEKFIRSREAATGSVVGVTGALYAIRRECYAPIPTETILDDVAIPMQAAMQGWRVSFETGAVAYDLPSSDAAKEKVRKVRTLAGNFQLVSLYKRLLSPWHNPLWGRFIAHKMLRLACPLAMGLALFSHSMVAWSAPGFYRWIWPLHVAAYLCMLASIQWPALQGSKVLRLLATFAHLNIFVILGFISFMTQKQSHLWGNATAPQGDGRSSSEKHP